MSAPKILKFSKIDQWKEVGFFPKILPFKKGSILDADLPKKIFLQDIDSKIKYEAELIEIVSFNFTIPTILSLLATKMNPVDLEDQLLDEYPNKTIEDFAFYFYKLISIAPNE